MKSEAGGETAVTCALSAAWGLVVTVGGWSKLAGLEPLNIIWCLVYLVMAFYVMRWARELLPIAVGLAALMFVFTLIAETATAGRNANRGCARAPGNTSSSAEFRLTFSASVQA